MCCIICNTISTNSTITLQSIVHKQLKEEERQPLYYNPV